MKKSSIVPVIVMLICSVSISAQSNQPKLNQVELIKKISGAWQQQTGKDTITGFEMRIFKDAVLETMYWNVNGSKVLIGAISFTYDPKLDKFKGFWVNPAGQPDSYYFKFSSEKAAVWEQVDDFKNNKLLSRNKFEFDDPAHLTGTHYNRNEIQISSSKWVKTNSGGVNAIDLKAKRTEIISPGLNQIELVRKFVGTWLMEGKRDTIQGLEFEQYGNGFIASDITMINGKKVVRDKVSIGYSKSQDMFKFFFLFPSGGYITRNGYFTSEKRFVQEFVSDFDPEKLTGTAEMILESPTRMSAKMFSPDGKVTAGGKFIKVP
ncbi:MAG TPA: hypothetical protein VK155_19485 [Bacteroidales bacterium]|jgi:hypothetical protein|nr:hypothetical protein [Bacteroidales bacterium]